MDSNHSSFSYASMNKSMDETDTVTAEESGWTTYFEDFMVGQQQEHNNQSVTNYDDDDHHDHKKQQQNHDHDLHQQQQHDQPELSDAASHVVWNNMDNSMSGHVGPKFVKKLKLFKKTSRRTREILYDDCFEDTASSPVNSPKVGSQHMGFNQIKVDDIIENSLGKGGAFEDQRRGMGFEEHNNGSTDLRRRGLCLVPMSMFVNYI